MPENSNTREAGFSDLTDAQSLSASKKTNYFLGIGIDDYSHCPKLYNAVKDVKDIIAALNDRFYFDAACIKTLFDQDATERKIFKMFEYFAEKITPEDNLIIYYSGHGKFNKIFDLGYWIPVDAEVDAYEQYIANIQIRNFLSAIKSHHTFLMVDSCFSGALFAKNTDAASIRKERYPSRWVLTAGRNEIVTDGNPGGNSPFAKSILFQLKNTEKSIGVSELCDAVLEMVAANADQTPRGEPLKVEGHMGGQFVFHLRKPIAAASHSVSGKTNTSSGKQFPKRKAEIEAPKPNKKENIPSPINKFAVEEAQTVVYTFQKSLDKLKKYWTMRKNFLFDKDAEKHRIKTTREILKNLKKNKEMIPAAFPNLKECLLIVDPFFPFPDDYFDKNMEETVPVNLKAKLSLPSKFDYQKVLINRLEYNLKRLDKMLNNPLWKLFNENNQAVLLKKTVRELLQDLSVNKKMVLAVFPNIKEQLLAIDPNFPFPNSD